VLPLLNGVMVSEMIAPLLPPCVVADGTIHVFSALTAPGQVRVTDSEGAETAYTADSILHTHSVFYGAYHISFCVVAYGRKRIVFEFCV